MGQSNNVLLCLTQDHAGRKALFIMFLLIYIVTKVGNLESSQHLHLGMLMGEWFDCINSWEDPLWGAPFPIRGHDLCEWREAVCSISLCSLTWRNHVTGCLFNLPPPRFLHHDVCFPSGCFCHHILSQQQKTC